MRHSAFRRLAGLLLGLVVVLGGCSHGQDFNLAGGGDDDPGINVRPANYRAEILAAMHAYLNDPIGVRDAGIGEPGIKTISNLKRYAVCVRFNARKSRSEYAGTKEVAAVFIAGRFDRFVDMPRDSGKDSANEPRSTACSDATYTAFPELEKMAR